MSPQRLALGAASLLGALSVVAQTVTYMPPVLETPKTATTPPTVKWHWRPDLPDQLENSHEIGYALLHVKETAKGQTTQVLSVVNAVPLRDSMGGQGDLWSLKPAQVDGKPVDTTAYFAAIFNPKPLPGPGYDIPAQLVVVTPTHTLKRTPSEVTDRVVRATLSVSETGKVTDAVLAQGEDPYFLASILRSTSHWGFQPASLAGKPVATEVTMAIAVRESDPELGHKPVWVNPVVKSQTSPIYPFAMRVIGINGQVMVNFVVTTEGTVSNAYTTQSTAPWFDGPAMDAVRKWTFKPATRDGVPAEATMMVPVVFRLFGGEGREAFGVAGDHPRGVFDAEIQNIVPPIFPYDAFLKHHDGSASVRMLVAPDGAVAQVQVTQASSPEFGMALAAAASTYTFVPAFKDGKPVPSYVDFKKNFQEYDMLDWGAHDALALQTKHPDRIVSAKKLDKPLHPISQRPPVPPPDLAAPENVMISILVDDKGKPQLAHVVDGPSDACAYAAIQAVSNWLFDPPMSNGDTVTTHVVVPVHFSIDKPQPVASNN